MFRIYQASIPNVDWAIQELRSIGKAIHFWVPSGRRFACGEQFIVQHQIVFDKKSTFEPKFLREFLFQGLGIIDVLEINIVCKPSNFIDIDTTNQW